MKIRIAAVAGMALAVGLTACSAPTSDPADSEGPIKVGIIADLSGATSDVGSIYHEGMLGYIDWINEEGGIDGRELEPLAEDYAYDPDTAVELYTKFVNDGAVVIQGWGTGDSEVLSPKVANDQLPFMSASYAEPLTDPSDAPYNFVVAPTYSDQMRVALNWIDKDAGGRTEVAFFHHDSAFGTAPLTDGQSWIKEEGLDLTMTPYPMPSEGNTVGLLSRANKKRSKYIVIQNVSTPAAAVAKDLAAQGHDMKIVCLNWCADELFIDTAGSAAANGSILVQPFAPAAAGVEGHQVVEEYLSAKGSSLAEEGLHYAQGWYTMHVMAEGIRAAMEDGSLSGEAIKEALEGLSVDTGGAVGAGAVEFTSDSHRGSTGTGVYQVKNGEMSVLESGVTP